MKIPKWGIKYGSWWAIQWVFDGWISFGIHFDFKRRRTNEGIRYAPYMDIHFLCFIFSLGVNPAYSGDLEKSLGISRGGLSN